MSIFRSLLKSVVWSLLKSVAWCGALALGVGCSNHSDRSLGAGGGTDSGGRGGTTAVMVTGGSSGSGGTGGDAPGDAGANGQAGAGDVPACETLAGLGTCGGTSVEAKLRNVNMLLVIDKSGSMVDKPSGFDTDKWSALKEALATALGKVQGRMNLGLVLYPYSPFQTIPLDDCGDTCCEVADGSAAVEVPVRPGRTSVPTLLAELDATEPGGGTPTAAALAAALEYFTHGEGATLEGDNYVLLATDGGPDCNPAQSCDGDTCTWNLDGQCEEDNCCGDRETRVGCLDDASVETELEALREQGISTFVVGIPGTKPYAKYLNAFAKAGGVPATGGDTDYYAVSEEQGVEGLTDVFETITTELVRSCDVTLTEKPPELDRVNVAVDCEVVPQDGGDSGWDYDRTPEPTAVVLRGTACERLEEQGAERVDVIYGCPTVR